MKAVLYTKCHICCISCISAELFGFLQDFSSSFAVLRLRHCFVPSSTWLVFGFRVWYLTCLDFTVLVFFSFSCLSTLIYYTIRNLDSPGCSTVWLSYCLPVQVCCIYFDLASIRNRLGVYFKQSREAFKTPCGTFGITRIAQNGQNPLRWPVTASLLSLADRKKCHRHNVFIFLMVTLELHGFCLFQPSTLFNHASRWTLQLSLLSNSKKFQWSILSPLGQFSSHISP